MTQWEAAASLDAKFDGTGANDGCTLQRGGDTRHPLPLLPPGGPHGVANWLS